MKPRVGINGFGRIGRAVTRIAFEGNDIDIVAVNTRKADAENMRYLFQYDSIYRKFSKKVEFDENNMIVEGNKIATLSNDDPAQIPWGDYEVDIVVDATGAFETREDLSNHLKGSVKKVLLTAPTDDDSIPTLVLGVNDDQVDYKSNDIFSNASCTTNCAAPMFKILDDCFGVNVGYLTTVHAYTSSQPLHDNTGGKPSKSRAATMSIIPSTTGAAEAVVKVLPQLKGKIDGISLRVPVPTGSFADISAVLNKPATIEDINKSFKYYSENQMKGLVDYEEDILVSSDYIGNPFSCTFDPNYTDVINGTFVKVYGWYDNEWGYSMRVVDMVKKIAEQGLG